MLKEKLILVVEKAVDGVFWGRVDVNNNLIFETGETIQKLIDKMQIAIFEIEDIEVNEFDVQFDISALFKKFDYLNISKVADRAGINSALLRQYASQVKHPSEYQARKLESTLHILAEELKDVHIYA
ncbi:MAG: hypothetical protein IE931_02275 [Sphingobacteriales bacterium]|nr:hypothetical protein [Sphingobacteriales bacterium]